MNLSDVTWQELELVIEEQQRANVPENLKGVLAFGEPIVHDSITLAKAAGVSLEAEMSLLADQHRFTYLRMALSIRPQDNFQVRFVALDLELHGGALCWSMEPMKVEQELKSKVEASISSMLKVELAEVGGQTTEITEYVDYQPVIQAFNVQRTDPAWEMRAVQGKQLSGVNLFHMVVRAPKAAACNATVSLRAEIIQQGFLFKYKARDAELREEIVTFSV